MSCTTFSFVSKAPGDRVDYDVDFSDWLEVSDLVDTAQAEAATGITIDEVAIYPTAVKLWVEGGTDGVTYPVTVTIQTTEGRTKVVRFSIRVNEC